MQINQLNIMKWNVIKYLLKSSESSGPSVDRHFRNRNESRVAKLIESLETCDRISYNRNLLRKRIVRTKIVRSGKRLMLEKCFEKRGGWGWGFDLFGVVKYGEWRYVWRIVLCHIRWVTIFCGSFSVEVRHVVSLPKESLGKLVTDFFKTFKIVDFRRDFRH